MNYLRAYTVLARRRGAWFNYFANHRIKDKAQKTLRFFYDIDTSSNEKEIIN